MDLRSYIRDVPDFPKPGILFKDITPLLASPEGFHAAIEKLASEYADAGITKVMGAEARGFIFAPAVAYAIGAGFVVFHASSRRVGKPSSAKRPMAIWRAEATHGASGVSFCSRSNCSQ